MKLEDIGFYTLSDERAQNASVTSPLRRCELILTSRCNFSCPYCRGIKEGDKGDISMDEAFGTVSQWAFEGLDNIRFSGGEPTMWPWLVELVLHARESGIERIALSTNGSATIGTYMELYAAGVNDFSISLDSCCASTGSTMTGGLDVFDVILSNIKVLSLFTYVTVGVVLTDENYNELNRVVKLASELGVADIRIIPAAQISKHLSGVSIDESILSKHPILRYRYNNFVSGKNVRGLQESDNKQCPLVLDDMAVLNGKHYPCIIYLREQGASIGKMGDMSRVRQERENWANTHNCFEDPICRNNCLDVCVDYNNKAYENIYKRAQATT